MQRVGVLVISKCLSAAAMIDTLSRSETYLPEFYVVEKQVNPFNSRMATVHHVVPDLNLEEVVSFASKHRSAISFALTDTEDFITAGGRDALEERAGVPAICVTKKYAVEGSKADQRMLFDSLFEDANPPYRVFDSAAYPSVEDAVSDLKAFASRLGRPVIKPDAPARGAGVGVWGKDFKTEKEMVAFFRNVYSKGRVVVEEKVEGEESSFHAFSDGRHFIVAPQTRDYKRALDGDKGRLTGGMGSYRGPDASLPFLRPSEWESVVDAERRAFERWKGRGSNPGLRGIVLYDALMHTRKGFRILERNSRGGNTEQINLLATMRSDFVDVCLRIVEGNLRTIEFSDVASVVTCAVPEEYGTPAAPHVGERRIEMSAAYELQAEYGGTLRIYPMDAKLGANGLVTMGTSRTVAVAGIGASVEQAREVSALGAGVILGPLRMRADIASERDIRKSVNHMNELRRG